MKIEREDQRPATEDQLPRVLMHGQLLDERVGEQIVFLVER